MSFIDRAAEAVELEPAASDLEEACRAEVASAMRGQRRMLTAEEIEDIVTDVVEEETEADPADFVEGGEIVMSDAEWDSVEDKVVFESEDGPVEGAVIAGRFLPASRIACSMDEQAVLASTVDGIAPQALYNPVPDVKMPCPRCASSNVTPVWYDAGRVTALCNDCDEEFDASIDEVAHATLAEETVEDIDILPEHEVFGSVWNSGDGFGYEIYASGDLVDAGELDTFEEVQERFDDIADAFDDIEEDTVIEIDGDSDVVIEIEADKVALGSGKNASRIRLARMVADRRAFLDNSNVLRNGYRAGERFATEDGYIELDEVTEDEILAYVTSPTADGRISCEYVAFTPRELSARLSR